MAGVHSAQPGTPFLRIVDRVGVDRPTLTKLGTGRTTVGLQVPINFVMIGRREVTERVRDAVCLAHSGVYHGGQCTQFIVQIQTYNADSSSRLAEVVGVDRPSDCRKALSSCVGHTSQTACAAQLDILDILCRSY